MISSRLQTRIEALPEIVFELLAEYAKYPRRFNKAFIESGLIEQRKESLEALKD